MKRRFYLIGPHVVCGTLSRGRYIVGMYFGDSHIPMLLFREFRFRGRKSLI